MAYIPQRFVGPEYLPDNLVEPIITFTNKAIIKDVMVSNLSNGLVRYEIYLATAGQDAQRYNKIYPDLFINQLSVDTTKMSLVVNPGDKLYAKANIPNTVLATISGVEIF